MAKKGVVIAGKFFEQELFDYLLTSFKDSFAHTSLTIESAFKELDDCDVELNKIMDEKVYEYYSLLDKKTKKAINADVKRFIVFYANKFGVLNLVIDPVRCAQRDIDDIFYYKFSKEMLHEAHFILKFDSDGNFDQRETFARVGRFFELYYMKKNAETTAYNMQKDHMDAFDFAMSLEHIGVPEIIKINEKVNHTRPEKEVGFKKTNNTIIGAGFEVADKTTVPTDMQRLLAEYNKNFGMEILDINDPFIDGKERDSRILKLFEKEAMFHIRFERIHPFADGNGRTGRIIMNKHLIDMGLAPAVITKFDNDLYKHYIDTNDYKSLALMLASNSNQCISNWVSEKKLYHRWYRAGKSNAELANLLIESDVDTKSSLVKRVEKMWLL